MISKRRFKKLKRVNAKRMCKRLTNNHNIMIDSFVEFYGEEYRDYIKNKVLECPVMFNCGTSNKIIKNFITSDFIEYMSKLLNHFLYLLGFDSAYFDVGWNISSLSIEKKNLSLKMISLTINGEDYSQLIEKVLGKERDCSEILNSVFYEFIESIKDLDNKEELIQNYFGISNKIDDNFVKSLLKVKEDISINLDNYYSLLDLTEYFEANKDKLGASFPSHIYKPENAKSLFGEKFPETSFFCTFKDRPSCISLTMFKSLDASIIHEYGHLISHKTILEEVDEENNIIDSVHQVGTSQVMFDKEYNTSIAFEEILNDMISEDVYEIFKEKGGFIIAQPQCFYKSYSQYFPLLYKFYNYFLDEIKYSSITDNRNYLIETVGKENYYELVSLIEKVFDKEEMDNRKVALNKETLEYADLIVNKMIEYSKNYSKMDYEDLLEYKKTLEEEGFDVNITPWAKKNIKKLTKK